MPEPLKNVYNPIFFEQFTAVLKQVLPAFKKQSFLNLVFDHEWEGKELKQRMRHISTVLHDYVPGTFKDQVNCLLSIIDKLKKEGINAGFEYLFPLLAARF